MLRTGSFLFKEVADPLFKLTALQHVDHPDIMRADFFMKSYFGRPARGASISRSFAAEPVLAQLVID